MESEPTPIIDTLLIVGFLLLLCSMPFWSMIPHIIREVVDGLEEYIGRVVFWCFVLACLYALAWMAWDLHMHPDRGRQVVAAEE